MIQIESITPSATDTTDRLMVRRGAGPADHTIALATPATLKGFLGLTAADVSGLAAVATSGSAADLTGSLPAASFNDTTHGNRGGGSLHANVVAAGAAGFMTGADKTKLDGIAAGAQVNVPTDLSYTAATRLLASSTGADVNLPLVVAAGDAGLMTGADKTKLDGIATGATANATDAALRDRATHTGTQLASTISDFSEAVDDRVAVLAVAGTNMTITYNDVAGTLTFDAAGGGAGTNLSYTAATRVIASDTGTDATLPLVSSGDAGLAPASGGGTTNFLRADGTWAAPGGGGSITLQDEGVNVTTALATLNVVGLGARATGTSSATLTVNGLVTAAPATDQANWSPAGLDAGTGTIKAQPTTNSFITGLTAGATDQTVTLVNDSAFVICLENQSAASTAANRFRFPNGRSFWLLPDESLTLRYSGSLSRWCLVGASRDVFASVYRSMSAFFPYTGTTVNTPGGGGVSVTATLSTINPVASPTSEFDRYQNMQITNGTASGTSSVRHANLFFRRSATADVQGFFHAGMVRFTALGATTGAVRSGLLASTAVSTTLNASLTNCLLIGADTSMTTLRVFHGDAAAGTPVNLGANFPVPSASAAYEYCFYCPPNAAIARYMVRRLDTRFVAEGTFTTNIPVNTTFLGHRMEVMVGATAAPNTAQAAYLLTAGL